MYNNVIINSLQYTYIMDTSMVFLTLAFLVVFVAPFFIISAIKERREKREKEAAQQTAQQSATTEQGK